MELALIGGNVIVLSPNTWSPTSNNEKGFVEYTVTFAGLANELTDSQYDFIQDILNKYTIFILKIIFFYKKI